MASEFEARIRNVTAVLGPTNTGKTHLAIERMLAHESGMIGLPLRLLAREVYDKIKARVGADQVALITGEEKIKPEKARYWVSTVEAMPRDLNVEFLAIDEIQLCADPERGHVFTDRLLHARGASETLLLGAQTMREAIQDLIPGANFIARPRLSKLAYSGEKKITRLPARSAIVAFSAEDVYAIAELIRRQRGGAAVVLGALSPRTRNAQVALYQSGDVEFLVATDAIGMGLNLDVDHVAFSAVRKFDGQFHRNLTAAEIGQIAGRAGRYMNDGTFGVTGSCDPLDAELVERLENHSFEAVRLLQWRNRRLDFASLDRLYESLREFPREARLSRARTADDLAALEAVMADREVTAMAVTPAAVTKLWDVCQVPDYRKISGQSHNELVATLFKFVGQANGQIPEDWFAKQVALADRTDGDIDTLATRIAHIRTWTFVANRPDWLKDPGHWQARTREIEDSLSDALHERLTQRFVDRRTSALMKGMRDKDELSADIAEDGAITVENHFVGRLKGFRFTLDTAEEGIHGKATRAAATHVLTRELGMRARRVAAAQNDAFRLTRNGTILWRDDEIAELQATDDPLAPAVTLIVDEHLSEADREKVLTRLQKWVKDATAERLKPLVDMSAANDLQGLARGIAFRLKENFGVLKRELVADEINALDQPARADLRKFGLRFGAFNIFFPAMLKPASAEFAATLWLLKNPAPQSSEESTGLQLPRPGLTSVVADPGSPDAFYRAGGFHVCGPRAVRLDILERLADQIRPLLAWRADSTRTDAPPKGATGDGGFRATDDMMSILGCSADELGKVLKALGFRSERRPVTPDRAPEPKPVASEGAATQTSVDDSQDSQAVAPAPGSEPLGSEPPLAMQSAEAVPVAESGSEGTASDAAPASEESAEEQFEEIWRPRRHLRPDRARGHRHRGDRAPAATGQGAAAQRETATAPGEEAGQPDSDKRKFERRDRHEGRDTRRRDPRRRGDKPGGSDQTEERRHEGKRNGSRGDRPRRDDNRRKPEVVSAAPPKRSGADPDSPFAALAALKASMDKRGESSGSR
jgi:ATP-dependent RNA helicase SUPV3L1/SUV3